MQRLIAGQRCTCLSSSGIVFRSSRRARQGLWSMRRSHRLQATQEFPEIKLITCDVDGTLLTSGQELTDKVIHAVKRSHDAGVPFILATGKAPGGPWVELVKALLPPDKDAVPGVYMQGLITYGPDGNVVYERELDHDVIRNIIDTGEEHGLTILAYATDRILVPVANKHTDRLASYKEPVPEEVGDLRDFIGQTPMQKFILAEENERIEQARPLVMERLADRVELTTALPGLLEVLPPGASKGAGVARLLKILDIPPGNVMAIGDGENDREMMQLVGWPVAMANAGPEARAVSKATTQSNDEDGVASAIEEYVLKPRGLSL